ncbi:MAG: T9SS type A sorting domain-containing protein [Chitinophagaceae bacterium]
MKTQSLSMGSNTINVSNLSKGIYLVSVITNEEKITKKLVVE